MASIFSGRSGRNAGIWAAEAAGKFAQGAQDIINDGKTASLDALAAGRTGALDSLGAGRTSALGALDTGQTSALDALGSGYAAARPQYEKAISMFDPWVNAGKGALNTYQGSLGLGGQGSIDAATGQFRASPGYKWAVDQATDSVARKASALGALGSGNTMAAISDRAGHMADQEYGKWQDRLAGLSSQGMQGAGAQAGLYRGIGDLGAQQGRDEAGIYGNFAGQRAGIHTGVGAQEANVYTGVGAQEAGALQGYTGLHAQNIANLTNNVIGAGTGAMMAGQTAAQNRMNFGMQGLKLATDLGGKLMGGM